MALKNYIDNSQFGISVSNRLTDKYCSIIQLQPMPKNALPFFHDNHYYARQYYYINSVMDRKRVGNNTYLEHICLVGKVANLRNIPFIKAWAIKENGLIHNTKGPAIYSEDRDFFVFITKGLPNREGDLPALIDNKENYKEYWIDGKRSRLGGPAIEHGSLDSGKYRYEYYIDDMLHRTAGPAIIDSNGTREFSLANKIMTEAEHILTVNKEITQEVLDQLIVFPHTPFHTACGWVE
jgi:hypothetical protein